MVKLADEPLSAADAMAEIEDMIDEDEDVIEDGADETADEIDDADEDTDSLDPDEEEDVEDASLEDSDEDADEDEADETSDDTTVEAPPHLSDSEKSDFAKLEPEAQEIVSRLAKTGEAKFTQKSQQIAEKNKILDARIQHLGDVVSAAEKKVADWQKVPWEQLAENVSADDFVKYQARAQKDVRDYQELKAKQDQQREVAVQSHQAEQTELMKTVFPELTDPTKAEKMVPQISQALLEAGTKPENLAFATAGQMKLAWEALQWRQAQAKQTKLRPKPGARSKSRRVKSKTRASSSTKQGRRSEAFSKNPSRRNAELAIMDID